MFIFLRHAANRFDAAHRQIEADQASGKMPKRKVLPADYIARRSLFLPESARYDTIMRQASVTGANLPTLVTQAMTDIETKFEPLLGVLPKDYGIFEPKVLEDLMRLFNSEQIKQATGDVFGRIYEYFLAKFSIQKAHDNGEFFTPSSIVQTIVNVIEPDHGIVFDPACGSGGMFVQSSHFIEHEGGDTAKKVVFYGQEKNRDTIRIAKMNLAVHGLEGKIAEAITYYQDDHNLGPKKALDGGRCDFVMANPPFNVDLVDAERIKGDPRLTELRDANTLYESDARKLLTSLSTFEKKYAKSLPKKNEDQRTAREAFEPTAEAIRGIVKQVDLLYKLAARVGDLGNGLASDEAVAAVYDRRAASRLVKQLDEERRTAVEQLKHVVYFHRQIAWLQDRFPKAELQHVPGLVKLVDLKEIEAADWSLTPGRYVGVAPTEEDEDFDFEQTLRDIHTELADLNKEASELAAKIQANFEELGI